MKISGASGGEVFDLVYGEQAGEGGLDVAPGVANAAEAYDTSLGDRLMCTAGTNRFESIQARDLFVVVGSVMFITVFLLIGNLIADVLLFVFDPRIRVNS